MNQQIVVGHKCGLSGVDVLENSTVNFASSIHQFQRQKCLARSADVLFFALRTKDGGYRFAGFEIFDVDFTNLLFGSCGLLLL